MDEGLEAALLTALFGQNVLGGGPFPELFAKRLVDILRLRPVDGNVRELMKNVTWPVIVEHFNVLGLHMDVAEALTPSARAVDGRITQNTV